MARSGLVRILVAILAVALLGALAVAIAERGSGTGLDSVQDSIWWAFVTLTTVGYGDRVPETLGGRAVGIGLAFAGVVLAALLTGRVASILVGRSLRETKGMSDLSALTDHLVICGWKSGLGSFLEGVMAVGGSYSADQIVLVAAVDPDKVESLRSEPSLKMLNFVAGDQLEEAVLARANVQRARRVLILADDTGKYSPAEVDARTAMTVIIVKRQSRDGYICAELLDPKFQDHLEASGADEIVLTRHSSRALLASAAVGTGISDIYYRLMTGSGGSGLVTRPFSSEFVGQTFGALRRHYSEDDGSMLVGLVKNTGNITARRRQALREAQKTADIAELVKNLQRVKEVEAHTPVLNPPDSYVVPSDALAILIQRSSPAVPA